MPIEPADGVHETGCPNAPGRFFVSASTGSMVPARCTRLSCPHCVLVQARRRSLAIAFARPERALLLTDVGTDWNTIRQRMKAYRHDVQKATGKTFEWIYHVEPNPSGDGRNHVHAWQHGGYADQRLLSQLAAARGMGAFVRVNRIRSSAGAARYGLKGIGYGLKEVERGAAARYLLLNGRRLTHQSRGFFRDASGSTIPAREAENRALSDRAGGDPGPWSLVVI